MEKTAGFLHSEFQRKISTSDGAPGENVLAILDRVRIDASLREREQHLRDLLDALPAAVYTTDAAGRITYYNEAAAELWGHRPALGITQWCGAWKLYWPDGKPMAHAESPTALALKEDRPVRGMEVAAERPDGTHVPFLPHPTPLHDETGRLIGTVNMLIDLSERKRAEEQHALLLRELHHRVKNTLATVQAIMGSTARWAETIEDFKSALIGRIASLAKTHLLLSDEGGVSFGDVAHKELDAFDAHVRLSGPKVELPSQIAVTLGMALHELTTNAAKYGALSNHDGRLDLTWSVTIEAERRSLDIDWVESGGPRVEEPARQGFGARLLKFVLPGQIRAQTSIEYRPEGLHVHCTVPLPTEAA